MVGRWSSTLDDDDDDDDGDDDDAPLPRNDEVVVTERTEASSVDTVKKRRESYRDVRSEDLATGSTGEAVVKKGNEALPRIDEVVVTENDVASTAGPEGWRGASSRDEQYPETVFLHY